jgi:hypothetical protein
MNKSEKSFYVIIENKKCGKFSGASPIQVAKKVASKKLKSKKKTEITFHLDEMGGKKKRYGPYQGRKDKKTGKVVVVKGGNIMKGGVLTANDLTKLRKAFSENCKITLNKSTILQSFQKRIINIPFGFISTKPLIFFNLENTDQTVKRIIGTNTINGIVYEYKYAVFEDTNGNIWIFFKNTQNQVLCTNFFEFFLNPEIIQISLVSETQLRNVLQNLISFGSPQIPPEFKRIIKEATRILSILFPPSNLIPPNSMESIIYCPNYSEPKIKKCVYTDLTFGILDEKNIYRERKGLIAEPIPISHYQRFLILRQPFFGGFSEPVIFFRIQLLNNNLNSVKPRNTVLNFDLYISKKNGKLILTPINSNSSMASYSYSFEFTTKLIMPNMDEYCKILLSIPSDFGNFKIVKNTANNYLNMVLKKKLQQQQPFALQPQSFALQPQSFTVQPQYLNAIMRKIRSQQLSFAEMNKKQKIQKQTELLQELANLKQELARLKIEQNKLTIPSVFSKSITSLINNPYSNLKLKPNNIPTIETKIEQIEQQIINSMQSG